MGLKPLSFHRRYFLLLFLVLNLVNLFISGTAYESIRRKMENRSENYYRILVDQAANVLGDHLRDVLKDGSIFALNQDLSYFFRGAEVGAFRDEHFRTAEIQSRLKALKVEDPSLLSAYLFRYDPPTIITDRGIYRRTENFDDFDYFSQERARGQVHLSLPYELKVRNTGGESVLTLAIPLNNFGRNGLLVFNFNSARYLGQLETVLRNIRGRSAVVTPADGILSSETPDSELADLLRTAAAGEGLLSREYRGEPCLFFTSTARSGLSVVHWVPYWDLHEDLFFVRTTFLLLVAAMMLLTIPLSLGVEKYMYRPIERLRTALGQLSANRTADRNLDDIEFIMQNYRRLSQHSQEDREQLEAHLPLLREMVLFHLLNGNERIAAANPGMVDSLRDEFGGTVFVCLILQIDGYAEYRAGCSDAQIRDDFTFISGRLHEEYDSVRIIDHLVDSRIIAVISREQALSDSRKEQGGLNLLRLALEDYLQRTITIGIGREVAGFENLPAAYSSAAEAADYRLVGGWGRVYDYADLPQEEEFEGVPENLLKRFSSSLKNMNREEAGELVHEGFGSIHNTRRVFDAVSAVASSLLRIMSPYARGFEMELPEDNELREIVRQMETVANLEQWFRTLLNKLFHLLEAERRERNRDHHERIVELVETLHTNPLLQIADVAAEFDLSPTYFGRFFTDLMKMSFSNYVNEVRLCHAEERLINENASVNDIAGQVGFNSSQYFIRVFKRKHGMTPRSFRVRNRKKR